MRANQVWALDSIYISMAKGFVYLTAVVDEASRRVLTYKSAITMEACHVSVTRTDIVDNFAWHNTHRPHSSLDRVIPEQSDLELLPKLQGTA